MRIITVLCVSLLASFQPELAVLVGDSVVAPVDLGRSEAQAVLSDRGGWRLGLGGVKGAPKK
jgi:hypothetical protein